MDQHIRRIVTGHADDGTAIVLSDVAIGLPPIPGIDAIGAVAWTTSAVPADNVNDCKGSDRDAGATIKSGSVFRVTEFGPGFKSPMHRTHSIDYCAVVSGELELILDGGDVVSLKPGDIVVQRGTCHVWRNPSADKPCRVIVCMIEAEPISVDGHVMPQHF